MKKNVIFTRIVLVAGILIMINLLSEKWYARLDFTADRRYTLSKATIDILENLDEVVTVTAYFSRNLPPQLEKARRDFEDLLIEYENRSAGDFVFRFINPGENEELERQAQEKGIQPVMVNVTQKDQASQMRAYMGATLQMGEKSEVIPLVQPGAGVEYELTTAVKKLSVDEKPKIAFLQGHGEPEMEASAQVMEQLMVLYEPEEYFITDSTEIPAYYRCLVIIGAVDSFPQAHLDQLDRYLNSGGHIYLAHSNLRPDLNQGFLMSESSSLDRWMTEKGWSLGSEYVVDASSGSISVQQNLGGFIMNTQKPFPFFPIITHFADHPSTEGLDAVILPFVSPIEIMERDSSIRIEALAMTSDVSGLIEVPVMVDIEREWSRSDFDAGSQIVAIAAEGPLGGSGHSKMVVVSNSQFAVNGTGQQQQRVSEDNVNFTSNIIDWLSDDTGLINLRTKGVTARPLAQLEDGERNLYKYGNVLAPILLVLGIGLMRRRQTIRRRKKRKDGNF